ncbi:MAG TPA: 2TM domain-containing protein [Solirubrobacteraceae bacterium]|nr:2TM domain-containing protein [Solirubrobacteraceae bacterium]
MTATTSDPLDDVVAATPEKQREQALLRLKKRREFKTHLVAYVVINLVVWGIWLVIALTTSGSWWPWPVFLTLAWGIGLVMNAWDVYFRRPITEADVRREIDRMADGS